jgi:hypothetical protein
MQRLVITCVVAVVGLAVMCVWTFGADKDSNMPLTEEVSGLPGSFGKSDEHSLGGIKTILLKTYVPQALLNKNLSSRTIMTNIELKLQQKGIKLVSSFENGTAILYVKANGVASKDSHYIRAGLVEIQLWQTVKLARDSSRTFMATTWSQQSLFSNGQAVDLCGQIDAGVDEFLNAYLKANPKADK